MNKSFYILAIPFLLVITVMFSSIRCDSPVENIPPTIEIIEGPYEGQVLTYNNIVFVWKGNDPSLIYRSRMIGINPVDSSEFVYEDYSSYSGRSNRPFSLDEGSYRFELQAKLGGFVLTETVSFSVDAIQNPFLTLKKRNIYVNRGDQFLVDVYVENVDSLAGFSFAYYAGGLEFMEYTSGERVTNSGLDQYFTYDTYYRKITSVLTATPESLPIRSISGEGVVAQLRFRAVSAGKFGVLLQETEMVDINGNLIDHTFNESIRVYVSP